MRPTTSGLRGAAGGALALGQLALAQRHRSRERDHRQSRRPEGQLRLADPDPREIPPVVRDAVLAWVAERNTWVHARRARVARATVTVWPAAVPGGDEAERCQAGGQFEVEPGLD